MESEEHLADLVTWVQCDKCSKWRRLPPGSLTDVHDQTKWFCWQHPDPNQKSCDAPAEEVTDHYHQARAKQPRARKSKQAGGNKAAPGGGTKVSRKRKHISDAEGPSAAQSSDELTQVNEHQDHRSGPALAVEELKSILKSLDKDSHGGVSALPVLSSAALAAVARASRDAADALVQAVNIFTASAYFMDGDSELLQCAVVTCILALGTAGDAA